MKQTAVEWLIIQIKNDHTQKVLTGLEWMRIFEQAKAMEKEQIENAYEQGEEDGYWHPENGYDKKFQSSEQYYKEAYGKDSNANTY